MSDLQDLIHKTSMDCLQRGRLDENQRIIQRLEDYYELTKLSEEHENAEPNPEWDRGYQAAMAIAKG